ncbi:MAG TPA: EamA family transporter, partial [Candidatus Goldiibacteriota bacterium]|nr:EamA family transporter [Candidatus Goldiibacteriota bacterium]
GALVLFAFLSANKANFTNFTWSAMALLMLGGLLANIVGQALFYNALQGGDVSKVLPITGAYPMIAFLLGVFLLGEAVTLQKLAGAGLVLAGIILLK